MPLAEKDMHPWMRAALTLGRSPDGVWTEIKPGSTADNAWQKYFDDLGWRPYVIGFGRSYTMPVPLPDNLPKGWEPLGPKQRQWGI
jgi:hypothetical protein